jgi:hypothetical protein
VTGGAGARCSHFVLDAECEPCESRALIGEARLQRSEPPRKLKGLGMAGSQPARGGVLETMEDFYKRRQREVAHFGEEAAAAARDGYGRAIRADENLSLPTSGDVMRYGASVLRGATTQSKSPSSPAPTSGAGTTGGRNPAAPAPKTWLDRSPTAKAVAGDAVRYASLVPGAARGAWTTAKDIVNGASGITTGPGGRTCRLGSVVALCPR